MVQYMLQPFTFEVYSNLKHSAFTMAHRAHKTLHPQMMVPDGFALEKVDVIVPTTPEEPQDYTTVLVPLIVGQYNFMTTTVTTEQNQVQKIPGYMRSHIEHWVSSVCCAASWVALATSAN